MKIIIETCLMFIFAVAFVGVCEVLINKLVAFLFGE